MPRPAIAGEKWQVVVICLAGWALIIGFFAFWTPPDPKQLAARNEKAAIEAQWQLEHRCDDWREWAYSRQYCEDKMDEWEYLDDKAR